MERVKRSRLKKTNMFRVLRKLPISVRISVKNHFTFHSFGLTHLSLHIFFSDNAVNIVNSISSHGRIADRLLSEGLLTPKLLEDLKTEWQREKDNETAHETVSTVTSPLSTKRSKNEMFKAVKRINRKRVK